MIREIMNEKGTPSLRSISDVLGITPSRIYNVSKTPIEGQAYDANTTNWEAVEKFISRRIGNEGDKFQTLEEVIDAALIRMHERSNMDRRKGSSAVKYEGPSGKLIPARRFDPAIDEEVVLKGHEGFTYRVIEKTNTHIALKCNENTELIALSNWTFNQKGINPVSSKAAKVEGYPEEEGDEEVIVLDEEN